MTRHEFLKDIGAERKWVYAWSFIRPETRTVFFPAWRDLTQNGISEILSETWIRDENGQKNKAYPRALDHIRRVEVDGWNLEIFEQFRGLDSETGKWTVGGVVPVLKKCSLVKIGTSWMAIDPTAEISQVPGDDDEPPGLFEGTPSVQTINVYERNPEARAKCIEHHGLNCAACGFNFARVYGLWGEGFIHVHHLVPVSERGGNYQVHPIQDLIPLCANCHSMVHRRRGNLSIDQLKELMKSARDAAS